MEELRKKAEKYEKDISQLQKEKGEKIGQLEANLVQKDSQIA